MLGHPSMSPQWARYAVRCFGFMDWRVLDVRTGAAGRSWRSYREAVTDLHGLRVRDMVHS